MPHLTAQTTRCTAVRMNGAFCDRESLPESPFPICIKHASEVLRYLNDAMPDDASTVLAAARTLEPEPPSTPLTVPGQGMRVVYYLRVGQHIKIGYSANLAERIRFYPPDTELLAYELGDEKLERSRLRQFLGDRRMRQEWFAPSEKLLAHIQQVHEAMAA